jgi:hypothetical protein
MEYIFLYKSHIYIVLFLFVFFFFFSFLGLILWSRIKHPFWSIQPVFHYYDIQYWGRNKGIISTHLPDKNRYVNFQNITTDMITNTNVESMKIMWNKVLGCVGTHYLREKTCEYRPTMENIVPYFVGHAFPCFVSCYNVRELLQKQNNILTSSISLMENDKVIGVMTSRPLYITIYQTTNFPAYYVDFLCVDKMYRKQNIAPQLIQTHEYIQSHQSRKISVSIFKREGELTGIVPLTVFDTQCFRVEKVLKPEPNAHNRNRAHITRMRVTTTNLHILYHFLMEQQTLKSHELFIVPHLSNLTECIKTNNIVAYMCINDTKEIESCFFYRTTQIAIKNDNSTTDFYMLSCFASLRNVNVCETHAFIDDFKHSLAEILKENQNPHKDKKTKRLDTIIGYISIENIGNNHEFIHHVSDVEPYAISPTAYFFYNYAHSPFCSSKCFILN